jgi:hypothetical protein
MKTLILTTVVSFLSIFCLSALAENTDRDEQGVYFYATPGWIITHIDSSWGYHDEDTPSSTRLYRGALFKPSASITLEKEGQSITVNAGFGQWFAHLFASTVESPTNFDVSFHLSANRNPAYIHMCVNTVCATNVPTTDWHDET